MKVEIGDCDSVVFKLFLQVSGFFQVRSFSQNQPPGVFIPAING